MEKIRSFRFFTPLKSAAQYAVFSVVSAFGEEGRALPEGQLPGDSRLKTPVTLHDYHPFRPVDSLEAWKVRQQEIRQRVQVAAGLWPVPEKTPLHATIHGRVDRGDYTVERVFFESLPGHFVSGSLYRPAGASLEIGLKDGKRPGVLCPHGHWPEGRFHDAGEPAALEQIAMGAERFTSGARHPLQARCVQLARMGCVVFHYDMLGYADSIQFPEHRHGPREALSGTEVGKFGFCAAGSVSRLQTHFGLQTWNSVRSLDFLLGLEGVDPGRIGVTGASGGGTQTQILSAIDDRVTAAFPCVMPSTAMQGGCTCENAQLLRIGQGNIDIAAAVAPRPLGITAADDWTIELKTKGHPDLLKIYQMVGASDHYEAHFDIHFKHNYNHVSRTHLYQFVNHHFGLGLKAPVLERDFEPLSRDDMSVWTGGHAAPTGDATGDAHERAVNRWMAEDAERQVGPLLAPGSAADLEKARALIGAAARVMIGRGMPKTDDVSFGLVGKDQRQGYLEMTGLIGNEAHQEEIPAAFAFPGKDVWKGQVVLWLSREGKAGIFDGGPGKLREPVRQLVERGIAVVGVDLFKQGEFLNPGETEVENPRVTFDPKTADKQPADSFQRSSVYYYGYNDSTFARRVHDILTALTFVRNHETWAVKEVSLAGTAGTGHWVAAARAIAGADITRAVVDTGGFRFGSLESEWDADFQPGAVKYGDMGGFLTLSAPLPLMLIDEDANLRASVKAAYGAADAENALRIGQGSEALIGFLAE